MQPPGDSHASEPVQRERLHDIWFDLAEEMAHVASWEFDTDTGTVWWSPEFFRIVGLEPSNTTSDLAAILDYLHPDDVDVVQSAIEAQLRGEFVSPLQLRFIRPSGEVRWVDAQARLVAPSRLVGFVQDVTERHVAEQERRLHTHVLDRLVQSVVVVAAHEPRRFLYVNERAARAFRSSRPEVLGMDPAVLAQLFGPRFGRALSEAARTGEVWKDDVPVRVPGGDDIVMRVSVAPMFLDDEGEAVVIIADDVTEVHRNGAALRESEERSRVVAAHAPMGMVVATADGHVFEVNDTLRTMLAMPDAPATEFHFIRRMAPEDVAVHRAQLDRVLTGDIDSYELEVQVRRGDDTWMWAIITVASVRDDKGAPRFLVGQVLDNTARRAAEEQLHRVVYELREANEVKRSFLSRMSHELRTPLNAVLGYSQLLSTASLNAEDRESVDLIRESGQHLLELIEEVLDITQLESGTLPIEAQPVDVRVVIGEAVRLVRPMADAQGITLIAQGEDGSDLVARADRRRLTQVLVNLLTNAIKYNRPHGRVVLAAARAGEQIRIVVADTGGGISAENLSRVFEPFERLGADQYGIEGTGIGLPLARSLAEHMGGELVVESAVGFGSRFTVSLLAVVDDSVVASDEPAVPAPPDLVLDSDGRELVVVSIEDNPVNQRLLDAIVRRRPYATLHHAGDGRSGIDLVARLHPDLVLLDLHLPDLFGTEVLIELRRTERPTPVIAMVSADANPEQIKKALGLGADLYLTKPIEVSAVLQLLDDVHAAGSNRTRSGEQASQRDRS